MIAPAFGPRFARGACGDLYGPVQLGMTTNDSTLRRGAEEARNRLPELLDAAEKGRSTIITRRGRPVAVLGPIVASGAALGQQPLTPCQGSGRGLWGKDSARTLRRLRGEWNR